MGEVNGNLAVVVVDSSGNPVSSATPTNYSLETGGNLATLTTNAGGVTETAPATDTASSGLNGRLQRVAQRLTSLIALLPGTLGQKAMSASLAVTVASDQSAFPVNIIAGQTGVAAGAGASGATVPRMTLASDDPAVAALGGTADAVVTAGATGSLSAKLRAISRDLIANVVLATGAGTGGISTTARLASAAASTNATNVKTSAGRVYKLTGYNAAAYPVYLVLYDSATNPPVPGTTTIRKKIPIPAGAAFIDDYALGMSFATGIGYAFTKLAADADTTALAAADVLQFNMDYV